MARGGIASVARLNCDGTCAGWKAINCCLCWGFCLFWYLMVFFVLYYFVKVQDMIEEEEDIAPAPEEDLFGLGGYGYGD